MSQEEINSLIRTLALLLSVYNKPQPPVIDSTSWSAGFSAGAAAAYGDCISRLREIPAERVA